MILEEFSAKIDEDFAFITASIVGHVEDLLSEVSTGTQIAK